MSQRKKNIGDWTDTLLALRNCVKSHPAGLGRALDIPKSTALYRTRKLEEEGIVVGYTPQIIPSVFGRPYLIQVLVDSKLYQFQTELDSTIAGLIDFLKTGVGHTPLSIYVQKNQSKLQVSCITMTTDIDTLKINISRKQNMAREAVISHLLEQAHGIPMYHQSSTIDDSRSLNSTETGRRG